MRRRLAIPALPALLLAAGCAADAPSSTAGDWRVERDTIGDTIVVRTLGGSVWGRPATLVEELSIGALEGEDEVTFGYVQELAPDPEGGVYVFDANAPALRHFDASGRYLRTLGREGAGPGEYGKESLGIALRRDGRIVFRDASNQRVIVYDPDGTPVAHWPVVSGLYTSKALTVDTADHVFVRDMLEFPKPNQPWKVGLLHFDPEGAFVDTIPSPPFAGEPTHDDGGPFTPRKLWALNRFGDMIVGVGSRLAFEVRRSDGKVVRVEKPHDPVAVHPEERAEWEALFEWQRKRAGAGAFDVGPSIPDAKPAFQEIYAGERGRIWVQRHTAAVKVEAEARKARPGGPPPITWEEPAVFDVFDRDGTYLGEVHAPPRTTLMAFRGDTVWGVRRGEFDEPYVVRFRVDHE
jgi:hypothetical protein